MEKVNYITQLNTVLEMFHNDERIRQGHITLYLALFQKWNQKFFKKLITINRELVMERAKIKSKTTYHNHLRNLDTWGYLKYHPSYHPARGSKVEMKSYSPIFDTSSGTVKVQNLANSVPEPSQILVSSYKHKTKENLNKQSGIIFNETNVFLFFKENNWPEEEAIKFYAYIQSQKWKSKENWQKAAFVFFKNAFKMPSTKSTSPISGYLDNLSPNRNKNYNMPL
ncbi:hypothetical protein [Dokdonia sp. Asnod1-B02]|uniref:hypothetical protein n=1 Tax=Dokdonia sp. Asnod1-B02 TaxID=3160573 RepID=UPI00386738F5